MGAFIFKRFKIEQERSAMKVNTDGVLLGAWMTILPTDRKLLDVGTGSGVIALMAAQRLEEAVERLGEAAVGSENFSITAIEIDKDSYEDALLNFANSPFDIKPEARLCSFQEFTAIHTKQQANTKGLENSVKFDLIFSNPPYFINSLKAPDRSRSNSRHTDTLPQGELIQCVLKLLAPMGRFALVLPAVEGEQFLSKIAFIREHTKSGEFALHLTRLCRVRTTQNKPIKRYLMELTLKKVSVTDEKAVTETELIMQEGVNYTSQYRNLTKAFYLNF